MQFRRRHIIVLTVLVFTAGCDLFRSEPSKYSIQQINPDEVRADDPETLTITGSRMDEVDWVGFGYSKNKHNRQEIAALEKEQITRINESTIEVIPPALPGIDEKILVWVSVGRATDESDPIPIAYRPPNIIDLYGFYALAVIGGVAAVWTLFLLIRRGYRRMAFRQRLLEAKGRRLALRDERRAKAVLAEIAAEKEAAQRKLEAEFLPYADKASTKGADD